MDDVVAMTVPAVAPSAAWGIKAVVPSDDNGMSGATVKKGTSGH